MIWSGGAVCRLYLRCGGLAVIYLGRAGRGATQSSREPRRRPPLQQHTAGQRSGQDRHRTGRGRQGMTGQDRSAQDITGQGRAGKDRIEKDGSGQTRKEGQDSSREGMSRHDRAWQDEPSPERDLF